MKPVVKDSRLRNLLIESQERVREPWEDEGDSDEELIRAIEVRSISLLRLPVLILSE